MDPPLLDPLDARIPQWDMRHLISRRCPFCETNNETVLKRPDQLPVAFCPRCRCWYVNEAPDPSSIEEFYDQYYHGHRLPELSEKSAARMMGNAKDASRVDWQLETLSQMVGGLRGKRVLEVGCGMCSFLLAAKAQGAEVLGCDLSPDVCEFARGSLGINVHCSTLEYCYSSIEPVDAVVMKDLIEHPVQPLAVLEAAREVMKVGSVLLLLTPNGEEAGSEVETAKGWVGFRVDLEHLQYVSPYTINWLAGTLHMYIERLTAFGYPWLEGMDRLPQRPVCGTAADRLRDMAKRIPGASKMVRALRSAAVELSGAQRNSRLGSYHLFAILRKQ